MKEYFTCSCLRIILKLQTSIKVIACSKQSIKHNVNIFYDLQYFILISFLSYYIRMQGRATFHIHLFHKTLNQIFSTQTNDWRVFCKAEELGSSPPCHGLSYTATRLHKRNNFDKRTFRRVPWAMDGLL